MKNAFLIILFLHFGGLLTGQTALIIDYDNPVVGLTVAPDDIITIPYTVSGTITTVMYHKIQIFLIDASGNLSGSQTFIQTWWSPSDAVPLEFIMPEGCDGQYTLRAYVRTCSSFPAPNPGFDAELDNVLQCTQPSSSDQCSDYCIFDFAPVLNYVSGSPPVTADIITIQTP